MSDIEKLLRAEQVCARYGVSDMTISRWLKAENATFPKPIYIGRFRYWREGELLTWENAQPRERAAS
jgi:predicted DNA-binding transcriptional regulator AlpA